VAADPRALPQREEGPQGDVDGCLELLAAGTGRRVNGPGPPTGDTGSDPATGKRKLGLCCLHDYTLP
jgi:hypothetical protein